MKNLEDQSSTIRSKAMPWTAKKPQNQSLQILNLGTKKKQNTHFSYRVEYVNSSLQFFYLRRAKATAFYMRIIFKFTAVFIQQLIFSGLRSLPWPFLWPKTCNVAPGFSQDIGYNSGLHLYAGPFYFNVCSLNLFASEMSYQQSVQQTGRTYSYLKTS